MTGCACVYVAGDGRPYNREVCVDKGRIGFCIVSETNTQVTFAGGGQ